MSEDETIDQFDRTSSGILEPDTLLAPQFFDALRRGAQAEGERRLVAAILEDAIRCLQRGALSDKPEQRAQFREAKKWISSSDESWFFSFENVCQTLGIDPGVLRRRLLSAERAGNDGERRDASVKMSVTTDDVAAQGGTG